MTHVLSQTTRPGGVPSAQKSLKVQASWRTLAVRRLRASRDQPIQLCLAGLESCKRLSGHVYIGTHEGTGCHDWVWRFSFSLRPNAFISLVQLVLSSSMSVLLLFRIITSCLADLEICTEPPHRRFCQQSHSSGRNQCQVWNTENRCRWFTRQHCQHCCLCTEYDICFCLDIPND